MKVLIESLGIQNPGGPRTVAINLYKELFALDLHNKYQILVTEPELTFSTFSNNVEQTILPTKNRFLARIKLQAQISRYIQNNDIIHFTKNLGTYGLKKPYVVTIHDLTTVLYPKIFPLVDVLYWRYIQPYTIQHATKIIAVSQMVAEDLQKVYKVSRDKVKVIYHGYSSYFYPATQAQIEDIRHKYSLPGEYILHVGRIDPKKNLCGLVEAFSIVKQRINFKGKLVLVGEFYRKKPDLNLKPTIEKLQLMDHVIFTGRVPDEDLAPLYSGALVSIYPTIHEGFGLSALEAMACGVPLITHKAGAVNEVVGKSGIILEKNDPYTIAAALEELILDPNLQSLLKQKGLTRASNYSWKKAAEQLLSVYEEVYK